MNFRSSVCIVTGVFKERNNTFHCDSKVGHNIFYIHPRGFFHRTYKNTNSFRDTNVTVIAEYARLTWNDSCEKKSLYVDKMRSKDRSLGLGLNIPWDDGSLPIYDYPRLFLAPLGKLLVSRHQIDKEKKIGVPARLRIFFACYISSPLYVHIDMKS